MSGGRLKCSKGSHTKSHILKDMEGKRRKETEKENDCKPKEIKRAKIIAKML